MSDNENQISDLAGISKPLTKLIDCVFNTIGLVIGPLITVSQAKADAKKISLLSEAISNNSNLPIIYQDERVTIDNRNADELTNRAMNHMISQSILNQKNIDAVLGNAIAELANETEASDDPVDNDWIYRFFNSVADISDENMQKLWGMLLAGEVIQPGSFSLRTIERLRTMNKHEAVSFAKMSEFVFRLDEEDILFIPSMELGAFSIDNTANITSIYENFGITNSMLLSLEECGLLEIKLLGSVDKKLSYGDTIHYSYGDKKITITAISELNIDFAAYSLTNSGKELYRIINPKFHIDFFNSIVDIWKTSLSDFRDNKQDSIQIEII